MSEKDTERERGERKRRGEGVEKEERGGRRGRERASQEQVERERTGAGREEAENNRVRESKRVRKRGGGKQPLLFGVRHIWLLPGNFGSLAGMLTLVS